MNVTVTQYRPEIHRDDAPCVEHGEIEALGIEFSDLVDDEERAVAKAAMRAAWDVIKQWPKFFTFAKDGDA